MVESDTAVNESELIDLTRAYVALSNAHRLEFIVPMFENRTRFIFRLNWVNSGAGAALQK